MFLMPKMSHVQVEHFGQTVALMPGMTRFVPENPAAWQVDEGGILSAHWWESLNETRLAYMRIQTFCAQLGIAEHAHFLELRAHIRAREIDCYVCRDALVGISHAARYELNRQHASTKRTKAPRTDPTLSKIRFLAQGAQGQGIEATLQTPDGHKIAAIHLSSAWTLFSRTEADIQLVLELQERR